MEDIEDREWGFEQTMSEKLKAIVIGAGQAGLSAGYHLKRRGLVPWEDYVVLDANEGPGGAWRHRWPTLTFGGAHNIYPLPGAPLSEIDPQEPSAAVVERYYGAYEDENSLPVIRPAEVMAVVLRDGLFHVVTEERSYESVTVINATGTWDSPFIPFYPGLPHFAGPQYHTREFGKVQQRASGRLLVVGGGTSAVQHIQDLEKRGVETVWSTRRTPHWTSTLFDDEWGLDVEKEVQGRTEKGLRPRSVVAVTGLPLTDRYIFDIRSGLLISRGSIVSFTKHGVVLNGPGPHGSGFPSQGEADLLITPATVSNVPRLPGHAAASSSKEWWVPIDGILWATGFRAHIPHLAPLQLREKQGGIKIGEDGVTAARLPGFFFTGYGASASTLGATRAGRRAATKAARYART